MPGGNGVEGLLIQQKSMQQQQMEQQQAQDNALAALNITGLDKPGQEKVIFKYSDGKMAVESLAELQNLGIDENILMQMGQVFTEIAYTVRQFITAGGGQQQASAQAAAPAAGAPRMDESLQEGY